MKKYPFYISGEEIKSDSVWQCKDVYSDELFAEVYVASKDHLQRSLHSGYNAKKSMAKLKAYEKRAILLQIKSGLEEKSEYLARLITLESGKTIKEAQAEISRAICTFDYAAIEVMNRDGSILSMDTDPTSENYECLIKRFPKGLCSFITPFNFPINLIAYKVAPAIAAGCPFIIKPSEKTPICALEFGKILASSDIPKDAFSILPCSIDDSILLVTDERPSYLSFTGSDKVGWKLKAMSGKKSVCLELGGTAACVVYPGVNLENAINEVIRGAFSQAGQSCISLQHLHIHEDLYEEFKTRLLRKVSKIKPSDPSLASCKLGPMISEFALNQTKLLIKDAIDKGSTQLCGSIFGKKLLSPTILESLATDAKLQKTEAFAPLLIIHKFTYTDELFAQLNESPYGIHLGLFTNDISLALRAWEELECAGLLIGQVPTWRSDKMPYGGIKNSGLGREGLKYAIDEMTEIRTLTIKKH